MSEPAPLDPLTEPDEAIQAACPALWECLSPLGRRVRQGAAFLPLQSAQARGKPFNATIGQITDGRGRAVPLPSMDAALAGLDDAERSQAFLYSPVEGLAALRRLWRERQRQGQAEERASSLPAVTAGPAQALALAAEMFVAEGRPVALAEPVPAADRELFELRLGGKLIPATEIHGGHFDPTVLSRKLDGLPDGKPAVAVLRFPAQPGGYVPPSRERTALCNALVASSIRRPLVALVDDTWEVIGDCSRSLFWRLIGQHPNLVTVKIDGADGELDFPGGRIGFLTFPFNPEAGIAQALESKVKMLLRAAVGSPPTLGQTVLMKALTATSPPTAPARPSTRPGT